MQLNEQKLRVKRVTDILLFALLVALMMMS